MRVRSSDIRKSEITLSVSLPLNGYNVTDGEKVRNLVNEFLKRNDTNYFILNLNDKDRDIYAKQVASEWVEARKKSLITWKSKEEDKKNRKKWEQNIIGTVNYLVEEIKNVIFASDGIAYYDFRSGEKEISKDEFVESLINSITNENSNGERSIFEYKLTSNGEELNFYISRILYLISSAKLYLKCGY